jgi:hypothetical protein
MFGGLALLVGGGMRAGVLGQRVAPRPGREGAAAALAEHRATAPVDLTGRVMHNFVYIDPAAIPSDTELAGLATPRRTRRVGGRREP